jgi:chromosome segregation ATPase
LENILFL